MSRTQPRRAPLAEHATEQALRERIKELQLIFDLSELAQNAELTLEQYLTAAVALLPSGWRYSDDAFACITVSGLTAATENYSQTPWQQHSALLVDGVHAGEVIVGYLSPHPEADDGPFFAEEYILLGEATRQIGRFVERIRSQETQRRNEARYRGLFEHTPIAIFEQDFSAVKQRIEQLREEGIRDFRDFFEAHPEQVTECIQHVRFLAWSRASLVMYGARNEDELQVGLECLVPPGARRLFVDELVWIAQGRTSFEWEGVNCKLDGEPFNIRLHWAVEPGYEQSLARVLVTIEDITEVKRLQQEMLRSERLAAMGQITSVLAHEVQNPLQAIYTNLELLNGELLESDEQQECLATCLSEVQRLREMTRNVLSLSRIQPAAFGPVSMGEVWRKAHHLLGEQLHNADIAVVVDLPDDLPPIYGVAEQLSQVLINLTLNALDSMPNGGHLRIAGRARAGWLEITCADNGPSIAAEHLGRVFDPFFTTKPGGVGLGLFVSHGIVQQHGGNLTVANLPEDQGVCFTITLPIAAVQRPEREVVVAEDIQP